MHKENCTLTGLCHHGNKHLQLKGVGEQFSSKIRDLLSECKLTCWHENSETAKMNCSGAAGK